MHTRHRLEILVGLAAVAAFAAALLVDGSPSWLIVAGFSAFVVLAENTGVFVHAGTSVSPSFMSVMASIAVLSQRGDDGLVVGAAVVGACGGLYFEHLREHRYGILLFNCGQYLLAAAAAAVLFKLTATQGDIIGAAAAAAAYAVVNVGLVIPYVAATQGERSRVIWADMRPAIPNYLAFGLLGLLVGFICAEVGALFIVLLAIPMAIGRFTFRSFLKLREAHEATIRLFIRLIEAKDPYTAGHTERVAGYALYIAEEMSVPADRLEHLRQSALMHDVGKLAVPSRLLNKPGRLTAEEYEIVRSHNDAGIGILSRVDFMRTMAVAASDRHGRFEDGSDGAPADLVREAHIVAVADAFDAMTSTRSYRRALDQDVAFEELRKNAGTQFDPGCVEALVRAIERKGERYGLGFEIDAHEFAVPPPITGVGSAGLGDLSESVECADVQPDERKATS